MNIQESRKIHAEFTEKYSRASEILRRIFFHDDMEIINFLYQNLWNKWYSYKFICKKVEKTIQLGLKRGFSMIELSDPKHSLRWIEKIKSQYPNHLKNLLDRPL